MIETFCSFFEGTFSNKYQAMSDPSRYAMVRLIHKKVPNTESMFYGEQAYNYSLRKPYRQFVVEAVEKGNIVRVKNYDFDKTLFMGFQNLDNLRDCLTYKPDCDTILEFQGNEFKGSIQGCNCYVEWQNQTTYVKNEICLGRDYYNVVDRGFLLGTDRQVWGSKYGIFKFKRMPL